MRTGPEIIVSAHISFTIPGTTACREWVEDVGSDELTELYREDIIDAVRAGRIKWDVS